MGDLIYMEQARSRGTVYHNNRAIADIIEKGGHDMPKWYHMKPVDVEAVKLTKENAERIALWCGGALVEEIDPTDSKVKITGMNVPTLGGVQRASEGMYIVKNSRGTFDVYQGVDFEERFERS